MDRQQADVDELFNDKNIFFGDCNEECVTEEQKLQSASSEVVLGKVSTYTSGSSPKKTYRRKEASSFGDSEAGASASDDSSNPKLQSSASAYREHSTVDVLFVEKEINVLVKLRCLLKVDKNTRHLVGKVLKSVHCESTHDSSSSNRRRSDDESTPDPVTNDAQPRKINPKFPLLPASGSSDSSSIPSLKYEQPDWTRKEWKNLNLLTTSMINFANRKLYETEIQDETTERANRPRERIHFSTPEVEEKYRKIVQELTRESEISSGYNEATKLCNPNSSRKRKFSSEICIEAPEVPQETEAEIVDTLGPIPPIDSNLFRGMTFMLTCVSREFIDPHQLEAIEMTADIENEEQWTKRPFVRERLIAQLKTGGGEVYESFELVPPEKYETTKLITNIPNLTAKSLLCLSVGIKAYNHQWIIRCCQENKIVNPAEEQLPAGWSLIKQSYVEMFQRPSQKPFLSTLPVVVVIPMHPAKRQFVSLWGRICENAGAAVLLVKHPADDFMEGTVVLTHSLCPSWLIKKAKSWDIPLVSSRWAIQCLIEGQICSYDAHPSFDYNYIKKTPSSTVTS